MSKAFAYILFLLVAFQNLNASFVTAWFYLNRSEIVQKYCINRNRPELKCKGSCMLKKKLQAAENGQQENIPASFKEWVSLSPCVISESLQFSSALYSPPGYNLFVLSPIASPESDGIFHPPIALI